MSAPRRRPRAGQLEPPPDVEDGEYQRTFEALRGVFEGPVAAVLAHEQRGMTHRRRPRRVLMPRRSQDGRLPTFKGYTP